MKSICKNCGHPIKRIFWFFWLHLESIRESEMLSTRCYFTSDCGCPYPEPDWKKII